MLLTANWILMRLCFIEYHQKSEVWTNQWLIYEKLNLLALFKWFLRFFFTFRVCCNKLNIISVLSVNKCKIIFFGILQVDHLCCRPSTLGACRSRWLRTFSEGPLLDIGQPTSRSSQCSAQRNSVSLWTPAYATQQRTYK